ncbi:hypothetical protein [Leucobacter komagatae]|nr:hypothetical protein [Leucobacter komagatae]
MKSHFPAPMIGLSLCFLIGCSTSTMPIEHSPVEESRSQTPKNYCEQLLSVETVQSVEPRYEFIGDQLAETDNYQGFISLLDTGSFEAFLWGQSPRFCVWGVPNSDNMTYLFTAQLPPQEMSELIDFLGSGKYQESSDGNTRVFKKQQLAEASTLTFFFEHRLTKDVWVLAVGQSTLLADQVDLSKGSAE